MRLTALLFALVLTGCGIDQQVVRVSAPAVSAATTRGPEVFVAEVNDQRPSESLSSYPKAIWPRSVGGFKLAGARLALVLEETTVTDKTREIIVSALRNMGYLVTTVCAAPCVQVYASVKSFTAFMPYNLLRSISFTQHMDAEIVVDVQLEKDGQSAKFSVSGKGSNIYQIVSRENWETAFERAVDDFTANFQQEMVSREPLRSPDGVDRAGSPL